MASRTPSTTPATPDRKTSARKSSSRKQSAKATQPVAAPTGGTRVSHGNRDGAIGTMAKPSKEAAALKTAISKARKSVKWTFKDSVQPELLLQADGKTVCYLVQRDGASVITARTPSNQNLNVKDIGGSVSLTEAVKQILAHMDARAKGAGRAAAPTVARKTTRKATQARKKATSRKASRKRTASNGGNDGEGDSLQADLEATVRQQQGRS